MITVLHEGGQAKSLQHYIGGRRQKHEIDRKMFSSRKIKFACKFLAGKKWIILRKLDKLTGFFEKFSDKQKTSQS